MIKSKLKKLKILLLTGCFVISVFITSCTDSVPVVTNCTSLGGTPSTSATIAATSSCTPSNAPSTSATITATGKTFFSKTHNPFLTFKDGYYVPIKEVNILSEDFHDPGLLPDNSEYKTDRPYIHLKEPFFNILNSANEIACKVEQTQYQSMINKGKYRVLIDANRCTDMTESTGYELLTVESVKDNETSIQTINVRIQNENYPDKAGSFPIIEVKLYKTDLSSTYSSKMYNTHGVEAMYFKGYSTDSDIPLFTGYLTSTLDYSGNVVTQFSQKDTLYNTYTNKALFVENVDGIYGRGSILKNDIFEGSFRTAKYNVVYNLTHLLKQKDKFNKICMSKTKTIVEVKRYGIYNNEDNYDPGSRLAINLNLPEKYATDSSDDLYVKAQGKNQLILLRALGDNSFTPSTPPKEFLYIHTQMNSKKADFKYNGITFRLRYDAFGNLTGLPEKCIDLYTGEDTDCLSRLDADNASIIRINDLTIPDGATVFDKTTFYYVKALEIERIMTLDNVDNCINSGLTIVLD